MTKYTTLQMIAMMLNWRSWYRQKPGYITNGHVRMLYGSVAWHPKNACALWESNNFTFLLTRPFWFYLNYKLRLWPRHS